MGAPGKNIEDYLGSVHDPHLHEVTDGANLGRSQFMVKDQDIGVHLQGADSQLGQFPSPEDMLWVYFLPVLNDCIKDGDAAGPGKLKQLVEENFTIFIRVCLGTDKK